MPLTLTPAAVPASLTCFPFPPHLPPCVHKVDEMGTRIDAMEKSIGDLMTQAGIEEEAEKKAAAAAAATSSAPAPASNA